MNYLYALTIIGRFLIKFLKNLKDLCNLYIFISQKRYER